MAKAERSFDADVAEVRRARQFVLALAEELSLTTSPEMAQNLALVVSELATNAVLHAGTPFTVAVDADDDRFRLEVFDRDGTQMPEATTPAPDDVTGRGLSIVGALATDWGVHERDGGKCVWAELPLASTAV